MLEEDDATFQWFQANMDTIIDFINSLHPHNLLMLVAYCEDYCIHPLLPDHWPVRTAWGLELLLSACKGSLKGSPDLAARGQDWVEYYNSFDK